MKKFISIVFFTLISFLPAYAADWKEIQPKTYIDASSVTWKKDTVSFWMKSLNPGTWSPVNNKKVWYVKDYIFIDCKEKKLAYQSSIYYDMKGQLINSFDVEYESLLEWQRVVPETNGDVWYQTFCQQK